MAHPRLLTRFIPIWAEAPALRFLVPFIIGIVVQWYIPLPVAVVLLLAGFSFAALFGFYIARSKYRSHYSITLQFFLAATGATLVWLNNTTHQPGFISKHYTDSAVVLTTLQEPLVEKQNSYKAEATVQVLQNGRLFTTAGRIILYFKKEGTAPPLVYGSRIVFIKPLQPIKNAGNPGGFDYERHSLFHNLFYQVFLSQKDYTLQPQRQVNPFRQHLFAAQQWVLDVFKKYIPGKIESGMAEALLIGYRNDLDRDVVQRYSNTGVVHIIAISGMHLGLIYWLVLQPFRLFGRSRRRLIIQAITAIAVLWFFSFLTGASPSILRSAVMFSFIAFGEIKGRRSSIYNNLALSAMLILLVDPFSLWDVGFQLSYAAVLSIVVFARPLQNLLYVRNKWLRKGWQLIAVTLAAQILTYPLVAYHFHQFPTLFLLTNLVAVPLSTALIFALIALLPFSFIPPAAKFIGFITGKTIEYLNRFIDWVNGISFSLIDQIYFTIPMTLFLFATIAAAGWWLLQRSAKGLVAALVSFAGFMVLYVVLFIQHQRQQKIIVYNVPQHTAIDVVQGNHYVFTGDDELLEDGFLQNFHLKPSRVLHQMQLAAQLPGVTLTPHAIQAGKLKVVIVNSKINPAGTATIQPDVLLICGNPNVKLEDLNRIFHPQIIVADASNKFYRIQRWQQEASRLHLRLHAVADDGAFVQEWK